MVLRNPAALALTAAGGVVVFFGLWFAGAVAAFVGLLARLWYVTHSHGAAGKKSGAARRRTMKAFLERECETSAHLREKRSDPRVRWTQKIVVNSRGMALHTERFEPAPGREVKGLVCALHGYADHIGWLFTHKLHFLATQGYVVQALDYEGHGQSDGLHIHVPNFKDLVLDSAAVFELARREFPHLRRFMYAESMGGAVALELSLLEAPGYWDGAILVAPMCKIADAMRPPEIVVNVLKRLAPLLPTLPAVPTKDVVDQSVKHPEIRELSRASPLTYGRKPRLATALQLLEVSTTLESRLHEISMPFLVLHGDADVVTDPEISRELYKRAASRDKDLKIYPDCWHSIHFDDEAIAEAARADMVAWLDARAAK